MHGDNLTGPSIQVRSGPQEVNDTTSNIHPHHPTGFPIRFAIFSSVLVAGAVLPYIAVRRHFVSLHRKLGDFTVANVGLQGELKAVLRQEAVRREEHARVVSLLEKIRSDLQEVKAAAERRDAVRVKVEESMKSNITELLAERKRIREQLGAMQGMDEALATIAAFMQEIEMQLGLPLGTREDPPRYDRIRQYAQGLHHLVMGDKARGSGKEGENV